MDSGAICGDPEIMMAALAFRKVTENYRPTLDLAAPALKNGGLKAHVKGLVRTAYNVPDYTFTSTFLRRFHKELPTGVPRLVAEFAGVRYGNRWKVIRRAAFHLGVSVFVKRHATGKMSQLPHTKRKRVRNKCPGKRLSNDESVLGRWG